MDNEPYRPNPVDSATSGCRDLNPGPLDPQSSALTKLRHSPFLAGAHRMDTPFPSDLLSATAHSIRRAFQMARVGSLGERRQGRSQCGYQMPGRSFFVLPR
jgi:hypothetical protein